MDFKNKLNMQMHQKAEENFKNSEYFKNENEPDQSSFVETAENRDKVSMVFAGEDPQGLD